MAGSSDLRAPQFNDQAQPEAEGSAEKGGKAASTPEEDQAATKAKRIKNAKALSIIQGALTDELFPRIRNEKTARGAWEILSREFRGDKKIRAVKLQALRAEFEYLRMLDIESLDQYLAKFFATINDLKSFGEEISESRIVQKLLMSLSRRYKSIVSIIEETRDLDVLRIEEVIAYVKVYDKREDLHDERDRSAGTERAFSSLKIGNNQGFGTNKYTQGRHNSRWQPQNKKERNCPAKPINNYGNASWNGSTNA
ncbi:ZINC FINGER CCHC-TYPE-RELATED [Salix viminalis]|uniref:ZINC FINGER CCHC-TYPE-RELATED n=1 Tax=Salix viminalis TaxID=40686 RepID=A0A9Q0YZ40_SALVM|nr:ZINC FINGER CCHC-TYPE-RELATED [Salix viminalis]